MRLVLVPIFAAVSQLGTGVVTAQEPCGLNRIDLSAGGDIALVWKDSPAPLDRSRLSGAGRQFIIVTAEGHIQTHRSQFPIMNMQWLKDSESLIAFTSTGWIYRIDPHDGKAKGFAKRNDALSSLHPRIQSYLTENNLSELASLRPPSIQELRRRSEKNPIFIIGPEIFYVQRPGSQTEIFNQSSAKRIYLDGVENELAAFRWAALDRARARYTLLGYGISGKKQQLLFSKPVLNLQTGKVIGELAPWSLRLQDIGPPGIRDLVADEGHLFVSASHNGNSIAVLESDLAGNQRVRFIDGSGRVRTWGTCKVSPAAAFGERLEPPLRADFPVISDVSGAKLAAMVLRGASNRKSVAVIFGGGPLGDPLADIFSPLSYALEAADVDRMFIGYPGSLGVGYSSAMAFRNFNSKAMERALKDLSSWIMGEKYDEVIVIGVSFGALEAYRLSTLLGLHVRSTHLIAPLLHFPRSGIVFGQANSQSMKTQLIYENSLFGGNSNRNRIAMYYMSTFGKNCAMSEVVLYFAERDPYINSVEIPACLTGAASIHYSGTDHSTIMRDTRMIDDVITGSINMES